MNINFLISGSLSSFPRYTVNTFSLEISIKFTSFTVENGCTVIDEYFKALIWQGEIIRWPLTPGVIRFNRKSIFRSGSFDFLMFFQRQFLLEFFNSDILRGISYFWKFSKIEELTSWNLYGTLQFRDYFLLRKMKREKEKGKRDIVSDKLVSLSFLIFAFKPHRPQFLSIFQFSSNSEVQH